MYLTAMNKVFAIIVCVFTVTACSHQPPVAPSEKDTAVSSADSAKNVILIIGDGMDDHQITIARNYLVGARGRLTLDAMPHRSIAQVLTVTDAEAGEVVYVPDSANTATSMATGKVINRGRIGTTAGSDEDIASIVELAAKAGIRTGLVSTASVTDATPASFYAHISLRACENPSTMQNAILYGFLPVDCSPDLKANGGRGSIAEQLIDSQLDVALGGGMKHFQFNAEGGSQPLLDRAEQADFAVITSIDQLHTADMDKRWLGLFSPSTMPVRLRGENGRIAESPKPGADGAVIKPAPMSCEPEPKFAGVPDLRLLTDKALARLNHNNQRGFFLMIESASIDKQSHQRKPCGSIGEVEQLNEALDSALEFAEKNPQTLIIVTADHGQAAQLIPEVSIFDAYNVPINSPGKLARIRTSENALLVVNYATNDFMQAEHTGVTVPVLTNQQGVGRVPSMILQPELFNIMTDYLGL